MYPSSVATFRRIATNSSRFFRSVGSCGRPCRTSGARPQFDSFKFDVGGEPGTFEGYASIFDRVDLQNDLVEPGAFAKSIRHHKGSSPLLRQHDRTEPIGLVEAEEDERGLRVKGRLALGVSKAKDVYELLRAKIIAGLSPGEDPPFTELETFWIPRPQ